MPGEDAADSPADEAAPPFDGEAMWKRRIALFLVSQNLSLFGTGVVGFAILWHITLTTSSGVWMTLYTVCAMLPAALISPWGGVFADRYNRKRLVMITDGCIAVATLGVMLAYALGFQRLELLLAASMLRSLGSGIQTPAVSAMYPQLVPADQLTRVQGISQTLNSILLLLSPAVGGVILATMGIVWTFMVDVVTAALAIAVLYPIRVTTLRARQRESIGRELRRGLSYSWHHRLLRPTILCYGASFFLFTPASVLTPLLIERSFGNEVWMLGANELVWSAGSILGGAYVAWRGAFRDKVRAIAVCMAAYGVFFGMLGVVDSLWPFLALMAAAGLFLPTLVSAHAVLIQENAAPEMMGRVFSISQIISHAAMPVAILLFGPLADMVPIQSILIVTGVMLILLGVIYRLSAREEKAVPSEESTRRSPMSGITPEGRPALSPIARQTGNSAEPARWKEKY